MSKLFIIFLLIFQNVISQEFNSDDWIWFEDENVTHITITKSQTIKYENIQFIIEWDDKLSYSNKIGYYGGVKSMKIYYMNELINTFSNIEDVVGLGEIYLNIYDYNMDSYLDFSIPISSGKTLWRGYYLFNPVPNRFENIKAWDYLDIQKINKKNKLILTNPDGNAFADNNKLFKVNGNQIIEMKY